MLGCPAIAFVESIGVDVNQPDDCGSALIGLGFALLEKTCCCFAAAILGL